MGAYLAHWRIQVAKIVIKQAYDTIPPPAGLDPLRRAQITSKWSGVSFEASSSRGNHLRARRLVFSTVPFCHGADGSQNQVCVPTSACRCGASHELGTGVEGDGYARCEGQGTHDVRKFSHDTRGCVAGGRAKV